MGSTLVILAVAVVGVIFWLIWIGELRPSGQGRPE
jgi:ABC-type transporter Mla subunit MlaD